MLSSFVGPIQGRSSRYCVLRYSPPNAVTSEADRQNICRSRSFRTGGPSLSQTAICHESLPSTDSGLTNASAPYRRNIFVGLSNRLL